MLDFSVRQSHLIHIICQKPFRAMIKLERLIVVECDMLLNFSVAHALTIESDGVLVHV